MMALALVIRSLLTSSEATFVLMTPLNEKHWSMLEKVLSLASLRSMYCSRGLVSLLCATLMKCFCDSMYGLSVDLILLMKLTALVSHGLDPELLWVADFWRLSNDRFDELDRYRHSIRDS